MRGRGQFVADIQLPGMKDVAFVRSPVAHARLRGISIPAEHRATTFTAAELAGVKPIRAVSGLRGFKVSEQPPLATDKVRHVGELVAMCIGATRAEAEDVAQSVTLDLAELPAVHDMLEARTTGAALVHEHWADNVFLETFVDIDISKAFDAPIKVSREIRTSRQCMAPIEGRGVVACWDTRLEQLTLHSACQMPHIVRTGLSECLGLDEGQVRIIAPDVGGAFGYKGILLPEEICLGWLAMHCGHPVRWIEDRREHLTAGANCREHHYRVTAYADRDGRLRGIDCEGDRRFRRLFVVPVLRLPGSCAGGEHPAGTIRFPGIPMSHLVGRYQQMPDPAVSRRGAHRRVLRARAAARCRRAHSGHRAARVAGKKSRAARADAFRQHHQQAFRQR